MRNSLPIDSYIPDISETLNNGQNAVLVAEPGSGKTTRVAVNLLNDSWLNGRKILMLEPRRLAAKAAANFISSGLGEKTGGRIGYRIRGESKISKDTRLEVITEGILTRTIQDDPALEDVGLVIFDEFHERSIHADLSLALALDCKKILRPDLRILIMSATIDADAVSNLIGNAKVINCPGRCHPVEIRYCKQLITRHIESTVVDATERAFKSENGDILVFLPGRAEIQKVAEKLKSLSNLKSAQILSLHSDVLKDEQDRILSPPSDNPRRIILSTNVAETSVTIPRVRIVIDSGLMRVPHFNPKRGTSGLKTIPVSHASATQRAGRAGREAPGICYRLWTEQDQINFADFNQPEILYADLSPFILELSAWGSSDTASYSFMNPPPKAHIDQAKELLKFLGALNSDGTITQHGKALLKLSVAPRLAHMLLTALEKNSGHIACDVAARLEDPLRFEEESRRLRIILGVSGIPDTKKCLSAGLLTALAYPDRLARQREPGSNKFIMRNGTGAIAADMYRNHEFLAIAHLDGLGENARVHLAEHVTIDEIREHFASDIKETREVRFIKESRSVKARKTERLGAIILKEQQTDCSDEEAVPLLISELRDSGIDKLPYSDETISVLDRVRWINQQGLISATLPDLSWEALAVDLENWLSPFLSGARSLNDINPEILSTALNHKINRNSLKLIDEFAPVKFQLPSGRAAEINYSGPRAPSISGKLQEMFGQVFTPRIAGGKIALTIELLSPAGRPLQVTSDLESFWSNSYQEVRKEMAGRYPKHPWPTDPRQAVPTARAKHRAN